MLDGDFCFWHDPDHQEDVAKARQAGGVRRRREGTVSTAYDIGDTSSVEGLKRVHQIAVMDTLSLENSISRNRTLGYLTQVGAMLLEKGDLADKVDAMASVMSPRMNQQPKRRRSWWPR
jgi:hypothetical protein